MVRGRMSPAGAADDRTKDDVRPDNRLAVTDHGLFTQHSAIGRSLVIQCGWIYEHPIDLEGVRRFHHNVSRGFLGRRIERSPLPFARHHWVLDWTPSDIDFCESGRPRAELSDWFDERAQLPIDAEHGPGWRLSVIELADGSTAATLVLSHYLLDGIGLIFAVVDAAMGNTRNLGYPPPRSRPRLRGVAQDARQTARDLPAVARAFSTVAKQARQQRQAATELPARPAPHAAGCGETELDEPFVVPGITISITLADWDARANSLGGTSSTLGAALAAKLAELIGRRAADGTVTLELPVNDRAEGDTRANAMSFARVTLDPTLVAKDLGEARSAIGEALRTRRATPNELSRIAWLALFTPKRAFRQLDQTAVADPDAPVFYSNLGDVGAIADHLDGTPAEYATARVLAQHETRRWLERNGGQMILQALRVPDKFIVTVNAYQPGAENTKPALRKLAAQALAEFDLTGHID